jgi:hypothetical protein
MEKLTAVSVVVMIVSAIVTWTILEVLQARHLIKREREAKAREEFLQAICKASTPTPAPTRHIAQVSPRDVELIMNPHLTPAATTTIFEAARAAKIDRELFLAGARAAASGAQPRRTPTGRFAKGTSGNPAGRPKRKA